MLLRKPTPGSEIPSCEITPRADYEQFLRDQKAQRQQARRRFLTRAAATVGVAALGAERLTSLLDPAQAVHAAGKLQTVPSPLSTHGEQLTSYQDVTTFNNFYEFGVEKSDPAHNAAGLPTRPWSIHVSGHVQKEKTIDIDSILKLHALEDRTYRHRCVEGWSMVIPWVGYSFSEFVNQCQPLSSAKYVQFLSYFDKKVDKWWSQSSIDWPYSEGLRMDEAMNPLTLFTVGLYGDVLPNQNGAPIRVVLPWKYGFKSAKSIVAVRFLAKQPPTTWNDMAPNEYGFYSNVNPNVDHPRWSQKTERRIGLPFYAQRRNTLMFNGYGDFVASMYKGMDLRKNF